MNQLCIHEAVKHVLSSAALELIIQSKLPIDLRANISSYLTYPRTYTQLLLTAGKGDLDLTCVVGILDMCLDAVQYWPISFFQLMQLFGGSN